LTVDYSITCYEKDGQYARALASLVVVLFPIGVPLWLFVLLFVNRRQIMRRKTRSGDKELGHIGEPSTYKISKYFKVSCVALRSPTTHGPHFIHHQPPPLSTPAFLFRLYQPKYWYLPVVDIFRRLMLSSGLLAIPDPSIQLLVALAVSMSFVVTFREWKPFFEPETDALFYVCGEAIFTITPVDHDYYLQCLFFSNEF
jgi:hypothetical protein